MPDTVLTIIIFIVKNTACEKYMKFTMYKKETTDKKYHENPYRAVNFAKDAECNSRAYTDFMWIQSL